MAYFNKRYHPAGTSPGTLVEHPESEAGSISIRLIDYCSENITIQQDVTAAECEPFLKNDNLTWLHVQGKPTEAVLRELGQAFELHPLALEDVLNSGQRPKVEAFADQIFVVLNMPMLDTDVVISQQVSIFVSRSFVVSFCDGEFTPFKPIVKRLQDSASRLRLRGIDFLMYSLLDVVIDQAFPVLESFGLQLEELEEQILESNQSGTLQRIHIVKREMILLRRTLWPQREVINQLLRDDFALVQEGTQIYLRDCYDHTIQVMELLETYRDMTASMLDIYLSSVSNRMNEVMRVLTVIATIFIPLTFIVGLYGMNFDRSASDWNMPELGWTYGYPMVLAGMLLIVAVMLLYFRRRGWF